MGLKVPSCSLPTLLSPPRLNTQTQEFGTLAPHGWPTSRTARRATRCWPSSVRHLTSVSPSLSARLWPQGDRMSSPGTTSTTRPAAQGDPSCATSLHFPFLGSSLSSSPMRERHQALSGSLPTGEAYSQTIYNLFFPLSPTFSLVLMCPA